MIEQNRIKLSFHTEDVRERNLASDYWRLNPESVKPEWNETVQLIADRYRLRKSSLAEAVRIVATAYDSATTCAECRCDAEVSSRSAFTQRLLSQFVCHSCKVKQIEARMQKLREQERELCAEQEAFLSRLSSDVYTTDYASLEPLEAILVFAIMLTSDEAYETGEVSNAADLHLCPTTRLTADLLDRLFRKGVIAVSANTTKEALERLDGGSWTYHPHKTKWKLAKDSSGRSFSEVFSLIGMLIENFGQQPGCRKNLEELWWLLALDDASLVLEREVSSYRISEYRVGPKTQEALRHTLRRFSIPLARRAIRSTVKNAAALSMKNDFNRRHALNTIPGNLISFVDRAVSNAWQVYPILNDWANEEAVLLVVLFDRVLASGLSGFMTLNGVSLNAE